MIEATYSLLRPKIVEERPAIGDGAKSENVNQSRRLTTEAMIRT